MKIVTMMAAGNTQVGGNGSDGVVMGNSDDDGGGDGAGSGNCK